MTHVDALIQRVVKMYGTARLYSDRGTVTFDLGEATVRAQFETSFERPGRFSFSVSVSVLLADGSHRDTHTDRVEMVGSKLRVNDEDWGTAAPESLGLAIARFAGTSSRSAHTIPRLLLPERIGGRALFDWPQRALAPSAMIDDAEHFVVELDGARTRVFVNRQTWLIRRVEWLVTTKLSTTDYFGILTPGA